MEEIKHEEIVKIFSAVYDRDTLKWFYTYQFKSHKKKGILLIVFVGIGIISMFLLDKFVEVAHTAYVGWFFLSLWIYVVYNLIKQRKWVEKTTEKALKYNGIVQGEIRFFQTYFTNSTIFLNGECKTKCDYASVKEIIVNNKYFALYYEGFYYHFISLLSENLTDEDKKIVIDTIIKQNRNVKLTKL